MDATKEYAYRIAPVFFGMFYNVDYIYKEDYAPRDYFLSFHFTRNSTVKAVKFYESHYKGIF